MTPHISPPPHHLCVILNYRPFSIFIWTRAPLESFAGQNSAKVLFDHTNNLQLVQRCLLNKYLIRKILAFRAELFIVWDFWGWSWKRKHFCFNVAISGSKPWDFKGGPDRGNNPVWQINKPLLAHHPPSTELAQLHTGLELSRQVITFCPNSHFLKNIPQLYKWPHTKERKRKMWSSKFPVCPCN